MTTHLFIGFLLLIMLMLRQFRPRPIKRSLFTLPLLLLAYGIYVSSQAGVEVGEGAALLLVTLMGLAVGLVQGRFTRVFEMDGVWMASGSVASVAIWLLSIPIRYVVKLGFIMLFDIPVHLTGAGAFVPFLFSLAGIVLGRAVYLAAKHPEEMTKAAAATRFERRRARQAYRYSK
jgi:hypothetical protein